MVDSRASTATSTSKADIEQAGQIRDTQPNQTCITAVSVFACHKALSRIALHTAAAGAMLSRLSSCSLARAEKSVQEQADCVRQMKELDGLTKGDPVLDEAVAELLQRKNALQKLQ